MRITQYITRQSALRNSLRWSLPLFLLLLTLLIALVIPHQQGAAAKQVIVTEFSDFQCPYCQRAASVVEQVRKTYGEQVKIVYKQMPLPMHEHAFKAARASVCAGEEGKFWEYHDRLFASNDLSLDSLKRIAVEVGLKENGFERCIESDSSRAAVEKDVAEARQLGVTGTPSFFVNGRAVKGPASFAALKQEIDRATSALTPETEPTPNIPVFTDSVVAHARPNRGVPPSRTIGGLTFSPGTIDFSYQLVGSTSQLMTETVTNSGLTSFVIKGVSVSGRDRADFNVSHDLTFPVTLTPGQSIAVDVTFTPHAPWKAGTRNANLQITPQKGASQTVELTGIGANCGGPLPACSSGCSDADGDGLNNAWESAAGIDINNNGRIDNTNDLALAGANPNRPDMYVWYDWMDYGPNNTTCTTDTSCRTSGRYHLGETCDSEGQCVYSCSSNSDCTSRWPTEVHAGDSCVSNVCKHTHDPLALEPNAFQPVVERFTAHGINLHILRGNAQPHSHVVSFRDNEQMTDGCEGASAAGGGVGLGKYSASFYELKARSNPDQLNLAYRYAIFAHFSGCDSQTHCSSCPNGGMTFGQSGLAERSGNDFVVSLGGLINTTGLPPRYPVAGTFMHELGHTLGLRHDGHLDAACRTSADCGPDDTCSDLDDGQGKVCHEAFGELPGAEEPNYKPNYLSIMNYRYQRGGIGIAANVGSRMQRRCNNDSECGGNGALCLTPPANGRCSVTARVCTANTDCTAAGESCVLPPVPPNTCSTTGYLCDTDSDCTNGDSCIPPSAPGVCSRLDYSTQTLPTGGNTPGALDESDLDETIGLGSGTTDLFSFTDALCHTCWSTAPSTGPVNWGGEGVFTDPSCNLHRIGEESFTDTGVQADIDAENFNLCDLNPSDLLHGYTDWPDLSGIPFNYKFQCTPNGAR